MAHGKTLEMNEIDRLQTYKVKNREYPQVSRNRALSGKTRRKARKNDNKKEISTDE